MSVDYLNCANEFLRSTGAEHTIFWNGYYYSYDGRAYSKGATKEEMVLQVTRYLGSSEVGCVNNKHTSTEIEHQLRSHKFSLNQGMPARIGQSTTVRDVVSLENGLLDLAPVRHADEPILKPHDPQWFTTSSLPFGYEPGSECPRWTKFLDECLESDEERILMFQEWCGYCCIHDTSFEKMLIMEGPGGNGKSQAIKVLQHLVGRLNYSSVALEDIGGKFMDIATLGKLINFSPEVAIGSRPRVSKLRQLISGDDYQFEQKNIPTFTATPTARFVVSMNNRPEFNDPSNALWRRLLVMPWTYTPPPNKIVLNIGDIIAGEELPGIFLWAIEGLKRLWANKAFTTSRAVTAAVSSLRGESDPLRAELLDIYESAVDGFVEARDLWETHTNYCMRNDCMQRHGTTHQIVTALTKVFPMAQQKDGPEGLPGFTGIRPKTHPEPPENPLEKITAPIGATS